MKGICDNIKRDSSEPRVKKSRIKKDPKEHRQEFQFQDGQVHFMRAMDENELLCCSCHQPLLGEIYQVRAIHHFTWTRISLLCLRGGETENQFEVNLDSAHLARTTYATHADTNF
jgi:hypothetical protein